jgi:alcohol dehydrogenase class IV
LEVETFEGVEPDPSIETVMKGAEAMRRFEPDWIVSIGGGSPIDAAKAMWIFYEYPDTTFESILQPFSLPTLRQKARFIAIPSTSGTATEVTAFSVVTDYAKGIKYPIADFNITPDIAIVDPDVADTMPPTLTAFTGMDALTHAHEAFVSSLHSQFTDPLALQAIKSVFEYLPDAYAGDKKAREAMHYAQCLAGMAFSNALLGIVHSLAHKTGAAFDTGHVPHGEANAIYLPYVIQYNAKDSEAKKRYAEIARFVGISGNTDDELVNALIGKIRALNVKFEIPGSLKEFGVLEDEFEAKVAAIAVNAVGDACTGSNPRNVNAEQMENILRYIYEGKDVDF